MNKLSLTLGIAISITALLLILNTTPNVAKAYSCKRQTLLPLGGIMGRQVSVALLAGVCQHSAHPTQEA